MRSLLAKLVTALLCCVPIYAASADTIQIPDDTSSWLDELNYYRLSSGLNPVVESVEYSKAAAAHAKYVAESNPSFFIGQYQNRHTENPASPLATTSGATIGAGNMSWSQKESLKDAVDDLMTAPIHTIGFLRENLTTVGAAEMWSPNDKTYVNTFSNISGMKTTPRTKTVLFPGNGAIVKFNSFQGGENPEPRESCQGDFKSYQGLAIEASLLNTPSASLTATLTRPGGVVLGNPSDLCVTTELSAKTSDPIYGPALKSIYEADHLVVIFSREPLQEGKNSVTIKNPGSEDITWSFTALSPAPTTNSKLSASGKEFQWDPVSGSVLNPVTGYVVVVKNKSMALVKSFPTTKTHINFESLGLGADLSSYLFCVDVTTRFQTTIATSCYYGPPAGKLQHLTAYFPYVGNLAYVGQTISVNSDLYAVNTSVEILTPTVCSADPAPAGGQTFVIGKAAGQCSVTISNEGSYGVNAIKQTFNLSFKANPASNSKTPLKPVLKSIVCFKGNRTMHVVSTNPKCPTGYKINK